MKKNPTKIKIKEKQSKKEKQKRDAIQCSTYPTIMGRKPRICHSWGLFWSCKIPSSPSPRTLIFCQCYRGEDMGINYSTGHWEGSPCFPSLPQALASSEPAATARMGEEWTCCSLVVFDLAYQGGMVVALESCSSILLWAKATPSCSSSTALSYLFARVCYLNPPH